MENIKALSMVEVAISIVDQTKEKTTFIDLYNKVSEAKGFTEEEKKANIAQFYTDVTASGDFVYCGDDLWDLKRNQKQEALDSEFYSEHQSSDEEEEEVKEKVKKPRKKRPVKYVEELDETEEDDYDIDTDESEDESYEKSDATTDEEEDEDDETTHSHEKDVDAELDEDTDSDDEKDDDDDDEEDEDFDEEKYNTIMDQYEDKY